MEDWLKFAAENLKGLRGKDGRILRAETWAKLHTPKSGFVYAPGGWLVSEDRSAWAHSGSNTMNFASIILRPNEDTARVVVMNAMPETLDEILHSVGFE